MYCRISIKKSQTVNIELYAKDMWKTTNTNGMLSNKTNRPITINKKQVRNKSLHVAKKPVIIINLLARHKYMTD